MNRERKVEKNNIISQALKKISYGFYIVTTRKAADEMSTRDDDYIAAGTVSWVSQASFEPPLVTVAIKKQSHLHETMGKSRIFAINVVGKNQKDMLSPFAKESKLEGSSLDGYNFTPGEHTGAPILNDVPAYIECKVVEDITLGDHTIFIGEVVGGDTRDPEAVPLTEWDADLHYGG